MVAFVFLFQLNYFVLWFALLVKWLDLMRMAAPAENKSRCTSHGSSVKTVVSPSTANPVAKVDQNAFLNGKFLASFVKYRPNPCCWHKIIVHLRRFYTCNHLYEALCYTQNTHLRPNIPSSPPLPRRAMPMA